MALLYHGSEGKVQEAFSQTCMCLKPYGKREIRKEVRKKNAAIPVSQAMTKNYSADASHRRQLAIHSQSLLF